MKLSQQEITFAACTPAHLPAILALQDAAFDVLENPDMLRRNSAQMLAACLQPPHRTIGAFYQGNLIAFIILYHGGETDENIGYDIGVDEKNILSVANVKLVIVHPAYRGNGLQRLLMQHLETQAKTAGYTTLCATVSPLNIHSRRNFEKGGFVYHSTKTKYGGLTRNVFYKKI